MTTIYKSAAGQDEIRRRYEDALRTWPVPAEHVRVPTREGETFVLVSGPEDAPPLLLLHGSGANAVTWQGDIASWSRHFRTYAVDLVGEPGLSAQSRPVLGTEAVALWLDDVLDGLGIGAASFAGTSLGGWAALDYAVRRPGRVARLALLCPGGIGRQTMGWLFKAMVLRLFGRRGTRRSVAVVAGLDAPEHGPALDFLTLTFSQFRPRTERLPVFSDEQLRGLGMPLLVIVGARDVMFDSAETARRVRRNVPDAAVEVLPGTGHAILGQTETVLAFLRG
ncbi:alpha/beta fold hydrolase [Spirillospora sp. NPDC029432]|uniref:alpha/beta fold hydrolase n=1 Tax=Spirillospora sp. NPDC029432 TaxID=3154599 RepID=UPI003455B7EF